MHQSFWKVSETHRNILDYLGGVGTSMGGTSVPTNQAKLIKYMGE